MLAGCLTFLSIHADRTVMDAERSSRFKEAAIMALWGMLLGVVFFVLFPDPQETWVDALIETLAIAMGLAGGTLSVRTAQRHYRNKTAIE